MLAIFAITFRVAARADAHETPLTTSRDFPRLRAPAPQVSAA